MLVISRKVSESVLIGEDIEVLVSEISGDRIKLCIKAPKEVPIIRKELLETRNLNKEATVIPEQQILSKLNKLLK